MKSLILISIFLLASLFCFSQQQLTDGTETKSQIPVQGISQNNESKSAVDLNSANDIKSLIGTKAKAADQSSINSTGELNAAATHVGEKAQNPESADISQVRDPAMSANHIGKNIQPKK